MDCKETQNERPPLSSLSVSPDFSGVETLVPRETISKPRVVFLNGDNPEDFEFARGQFRMKYYLPKDKTEGLEDAPPFVSNKLVRAEDGRSEAKRIHVYDWQIRDEGRIIDGEPHVTVYARFAILDNPVWLVPALWAITAVGGTVGSWFVIDKIESFTETGIGQIVIVAASALTLWVVWKDLK